MLEKAKEKLKAEMERNKNNGYIQAVGQFLLEHLNNAPESAATILTEGKTIDGSFKAMETEARKKPRINNMVMLTPQEGFDLVLQYFGMKGAAPAPGKIEVAEKPSTDFNINLEDLLV